MAAITDYFKPGQLRLPVLRPVIARTAPTPKRPVGRPRKRQKLELDIEQEGATGEDNEEIAQYNVL